MPDKVVPPKLNQLADGSLVAFYFKSSYAAGHLLAVAALFTLSLLLGFLPQVLMGYWAFFWSQLYGDSVYVLINTSVFMALQAVVFTLMEKVLDFACERLALEQAAVLRDGVLRKILRIDPAYLSTLDGQKISEPDAFYDRVNKIVRKSLFSVGVVFGNVVYLARYGLFRIGLLWSVFVVATDYVVYKLSQPSSGKASFFSVSLSDITTASNQAQNTLRAGVEDLQANQSFLWGQPGFLACEVARIRHKLNASCEQALHAYYYWHDTVEACVEIIRRLIQPLATLMIVCGLALRLPLDGSLLNRGITVGIITQLVNCFAQLWRFGSVFKNYPKDVSNCTSSYDNMRSFMRVMPFSASDMAVTGPPPSLWVVFGNQLLFSAWCYEALGVVVATITDFGLDSFTPGLMPVAVGWRFLLLTIASAGTSKNHSMVNVFSIALGVLAAMVSYALLCFASVYPLMMVETACWALYGPYVAVSSVSCLLSYGYVNRRYMQTTNQLSSVVQASDSLLKAVPMQDAHKSLTAGKSNLISTSAVLSNLALFPNKKDVKSVITFAPDTTVSFATGKPAVVVGENGLGKSSLVIAALTKGGTSLAHETCQLRGNIALSVDKKLIFGQTHNPTANIDLYRLDYDLRDRWGKSYPITPLQRMFFAMTMTDPGCMTVLDERIYANWSLCKHAMRNFLQDDAFAMDAAFLDTLFVQEQVGADVTGGRAAKCIAAMVYAAMSMTQHSDKFGKLSLLVAVDEGFGAVTAAERAVIYKKFCGIARGSSALTFVAVLHDAALQKHFSERIVLSKQTTDSDRVVTVDQQSIPSCSS